MQSRLNTPRARALRLLILLFVCWALLASTCGEDPRRRDVARICGDTIANCGCWAQYGYDTCP